MSSHGDIRSGRCNYKHAWKSDWKKVVPGRSCYNEVMQGSGSLGNMQCKVDVWLTLQQKFNQTDYIETTRRLIEKYRKEEKRAVDFITVAAIASYSN